ncbi:MAG: hypothetical protein IRZ05_20345 [Micromonosporaceae bacterium]|nr:hypothetical protein [Micromonosporaceae bacterium]
MLPAASVVSPSPLLRLRFALSRINLATYDRGYLIRGDTLYMAHVEHDGLHVARHSLDGAKQPYRDTVLGTSGADLWLWLGWAQPVLVVRFSAKGRGPAESPTLTAIDPASGRRLWSQPGTWLQPDGHGHAVYLGPDGSELTAVDLRTGNVRQFDWCGGAWCGGGDGQVLVVDARSGNAHLVVVPDLELPGARTPNRRATLVGGRTVSSARGTLSLLRVVDPKSGRVVVRAAEWSVLDFQQIQVTLGDAYVVAHDGVRERRWVGVVPLDHPRLVALGQIKSDEAGQCSAQGRYLACLGIDRVLRVWQYTLP